MKDEQILGNWEFDEQLHDDLKNGDIYRTITFETTPVDEQTYEGLAYLAHREALREVLICANPNLSISVAGGIEAATYLANAILAAGYAKISEVAREIFAEIDLIFRKQFEKCSESTELKLLEPLLQAERFIINEVWHEVAELKKKYTEGGNDRTT